jgi:1,4-alpha-glucan branching enzyme
MARLGSFTLFLHSHIPYVLSHGTWPDGMDWLNEAASEVYIPLLEIFNRLVGEGHLPRVVVGISPVLAEQLAAPAFKEGLRGYLKKRIDTAREDGEQFAKWNWSNMKRVADMWQDYFANALRLFEDTYGGDLVGAFKRLQDTGALEIITCAGTHGYLPLLGEDSAIKAQIRVGVETYRKHFDRHPRGIWLPECAYRPGYQWKHPIDGFGKERMRKGIEEFIHEDGIDYFVVDSHLLKGGKAIGVYIHRFEALKQLWKQFEREYTVEAKGIEKSPYRVYLVSSSFGWEKPVAIFTRDPETGRQVWSGEWGYPGDGYYLDFHKKRFPEGHRYWRVTSAKTALGRKEEYRPGWVEERIRENASHFKDLVKGILSRHRQESGNSGIVSAPFDCELLGHWWFEGPRWLYYVLKWMDMDPEMELTTGGEYLDRNPPQQVISLPEGSWGEGGFHWIWFNEWNKWTWELIYDAEAKMKEMAQKHAKTSDPDLIRLLRQMARELLLLESSDWQFLISTWSARDYAELRVREHYEDFMRLYNLVQKRARGVALHTGDWEFLRDCENRDALFPHIELGWWA